MKLRHIFYLNLSIICTIFIFSNDYASARKFDPPANQEEIESIEKKPNGERLLQLLAIEEESPDYIGRRFTSINNANTHYILKSRVFREGFALYRIPAMEPRGIKIIGPKIYSSERHAVIGKERVSDTGQPQPPELLREIKTLNDIAGIVKIQNKEDAIEYVRLGSSGLTFDYFAPQMEEVFCVMKVPSGSNDRMMTFGECAKLGLKPPKVKIVKSPEVEIQSNPGKSRFKMTAKSKKQDQENAEDEENDDKDDGINAKFFNVTRNIEIDSENAIFRITEEVGRNGEWRIVEKKLVHHF